jgi:hypothetical protein
MQSVHFCTRVIQRLRILPNYLAEVYCVRNRPKNSDSEGFERSLMSVALAAIAKAQHLHWIRLRIIKSLNMLNRVRVL